ncbi:MAG: hypothetical protein M5U28_21495 [Sandaracinaceae bacterium]|nr:hypothetical protein [Sandaracinaceae bacterium]
MLRDLLRTSALAAALMLVGCGNGVGVDGPVVGGDCVVSSECAMESRCLTGEAYPGGYCAKSCASDEDCPDGSACVEQEGGVCLLACGGASDCREGYDCLEMDVRGGPGTSSVCATP